MKPLVLIGFADAFAAIESAWCLARRRVRVCALTRSGTRPALAHSRFVRVVPITAPEVDACQSVADLTDDDNVIHIPVWGSVPFFGDAPPIGDLLVQAAEAGGTAVWVHPWRQASWKRFDPSWWEHLGGVEVWNRKYDGIAPRAGSLSLARQNDVRHFISLDLHTRRQLFPLSLALGVAADGPGTGRQPGKLDLDMVYAALREGSFAARAFGIPLERLASGPPGGLESMRRAAARAYRAGRQGGRPGDKP